MCIAFDRPLRDDNTSGNKKKAAPAVPPANMDVTPCQTQGTKTASCWQEE